jgi:hypothetical protein
LNTRRATKGEALGLLGDLLAKLTSQINGFFFPRKSLENPEEYLEIK